MDFGVKGALAPQEPTESAFCWGEGVWMVTGTTYNNHIDYDILQVGKTLQHVSVCKQEPAATESFPFCSRFASTDIKRNLKSLQKKEIKTKFKKTHTYIIVVSGHHLKNNFHYISICPATQGGHLKIHTSRHRTKGSFEVGHFSTNCHPLHENRSLVFKFMAL